MVFLIVGYIKRGVKKRTNAEDGDKTLSHSQVVPNSEPVNKQRKFSHVMIDTSKYQLPNFFGTKIDYKIEKKIPLESNEISSLCRELARSIEHQFKTVHPHSQSINYVVNKLLMKYPSLIIDELMGNETNVI